MHGTRFSYWISTLIHVSIIEKEVTKTKTSFMAKVAKSIYGSSGLFGRSFNTLLNSNLFMICFAQYKNCCY